MLRRKARLPPNSTAITACTSGRRFSMAVRVLPSSPSLRWRLMTSRMCCGSRAIFPLHMMFIGRIKSDWMWNGGSWQGRGPFYFGEGFRSESAARWLRHAEDFADSPRPLLLVHTIFTFMQHECGRRARRRTRGDIPVADQQTLRSSLIFATSRIFPRRSLGNAVHADKAPCPTAPVCPSFCHGDVRYHSRQDAADLPSLRG